MQRYPCFLIGIWAIFFIGRLSAQLPTDTFTAKTIDISFLEQVTHDQINELRKLKGSAKPMTHALGMQQAARFHAEYLLKKKEISHEQDDQKMRYFSNRIEHFNPEISGSMMGENCLRFPLDLAINTGEYGKYSYLRVARDLAISWYHSPGHRANMLNKSYTHSGLAIAFDTLTDDMYVVQVYRR
jgi:uncharacterized protein YkwD